MTAGCTNVRYGQSFYDIALSPDGHTLYGVDDNDDVVVAFARDAGSGNLTPIAYAARSASVPQQAGALRSPGASRPGLLQHRT